MATTPTTPFPSLLAPAPSHPTARPSLSSRHPPTFSISVSASALRRLAAASKDTANSKGQEQEPSAAAVAASEAAKGTEEGQAASTEKSQEAVAAELREVLWARKEEAAAGGGGGWLAGVAQEMVEIGWLAPRKMVGTTGVVLGVIAGSTAALLSVNALLAELSDCVFARISGCGPTRREGSVGCTITLNSFF